MNMYNNVKTNVLEKENAEERQYAKDATNLDKILGMQDADDTKVLGENVKAPLREFDEDLIPSSTTMQFESDEDNDIYEEVRPKNETDLQKKYKINTKGKVLIAVYALVIATILSLIVINSRMLKSLDNSISGYAGKITELTEQYTNVTAELDYVKSDEVIIEKILAGVRFLNGSAVRIGVGCSFNFRILWKRYHTGKTFLFCVLQGIMCKIIITEIKYGTGIVDIIEVITG